MIVVLLRLCLNYKSACAAGFMLHLSALHYVSYGGKINMLLVGANKSLTKRSLTGCQIQSVRHQGKLSR